MAPSSPNCSLKLYKSIIHLSLLLCPTHNKFFLLAGPNPVSFIRRPAHHKRKSTALPWFIWWFHLLNLSSPLVRFPAFLSFTLHLIQIFLHLPIGPNALLNSDIPWPADFWSLFDGRPKMLSSLPRTHNFPPSCAHGPLRSPEKPVKSMALRLVALMIVTVRRPAVGK